MKHIVMFSSGAGSWAAAKRVVEAHGAADTLLVFADTKIEDEDNYRFLEQAAVNVGAELITLADGRDPWQVFHDERFLGNTRIDPCSKILKRQIIRRWLNEHHAPDECVIYLGIDWTEEHRLDRARPYWKPYEISAPMTVPPIMEKWDVLDWLRKEGIEPPRLYAMGFPHANCGGFCIKAGMTHFALLLRVMPARYAYHERKEEEFRAFIGKDVSILKDRRGGTTKPLTLKAFRERQEGGCQLDLFDWGGCGCFSPF